MLATIGSIIVAALLSLIPAIAIGGLAALIAGKTNPHDPMGPGLMLMVFGLIVYVLSLVALLWWGL